MLGMQSTCPTFLSLVHPFRDDRRDTKFFLLADKLVADTEHDDATLSAFAGILIFVEVLAEKVQSDIVMDIQANKEVLVEEILGLQHGAHTGAQ